MPLRLGSLRQVYSIKPNPSGQLTVSHPEPIQSTQGCAKLGCRNDGIYAAASGPAK